MIYIKNVEPIGGEFGVSCFLPTFKDIIGFMEGQYKLSCGYTRFVVHPYIDQLIKKDVGDGYFIVLTSKEAAVYFKDNFSSIKNSVIITTKNATYIKVETYEDYLIIFRELRNSGFILSPRTAKRILDSSDLIALDNTYSDENLKKQLVSYEKGAIVSKTFLFPSGMAALFTAMQSVITKDKSHFIMLGSPYVDTRELLEKIPTKQGLIQTSFVNKYQDIEDVITNKTCAIIFEFPTNPLLEIADIKEVVNIARKYNTNVIVDATIASSYNVSPLQYGVDIVMHSTTKFLSGNNNHIGGVLFVNKNSSISNNIDLFQKKCNIFMSKEEAKILEENVKEFISRMKIINENAKIIAEYLNNHEKIEKVYSAELSNHPNYKVGQYYFTNGSSGVISFILKNSSFNIAEMFYDNCTLSGKGPSLGSEQTLLCPITILSFFNKQDEELKAIGQDRYTMRISVGCEDVKQIIGHLENGLKAIK